MFLLFLFLLTNTSNIIFRLSNLLWLPHSPNPSIKLKNQSLGQLNNILTSPRNCSQQIFLHLQFFLFNNLVSRAIFIFYLYLFYINFSFSVLLRLLLQKNAFLSERKTCKSIRARERVRKEMKWIKHVSRSLNWCLKLVLRKIFIHNNLCIFNKIWF